MTQLNSIGVLGPAPLQALPTGTPQTAGAVADALPPPGGDAAMQVNLSHEAHEGAPPGPHPGEHPGEHELDLRNFAHGLFGGPGEHGPEAGADPLQAQQAQQGQQAQGVDPLAQQVEQMQRQLDQLMQQAQYHMDSGNEPAYNQTVHQIDTLEAQLASLLGGTQGMGGGGVPAGGGMPFGGGIPMGGGVPMGGGIPMGGGAPVVQGGGGGGGGSRGRHEVHVEGPGGFPPTYPRGRRQSGGKQAQGAAPSGGQQGGAQEVGRGRRPKGHEAGAGQGTVPVESGRPQEVTTGDAPRRPHGLREIQQTFGAAGTNQVSVRMPAGPNGQMRNVTCNKRIAGQMKAAFEEIKEKGLSGNIRSFDGSFCNRNKRGGSTKSVHSWGIAFDVNASANPMGSSHQTAGQRQLAAIFEKHGFHQLKNDPMHFQYATGY